MTKVLYIALDERPCNRVFPLKLFSSDIIFVKGLDPDVFGYKETSADFNRIETFIEKEIKDTSYLVVSLDMWLYGGLVPSRVHSFDQNELYKRLEKLKELKQRYPNLKIYAFSTIMRVTQYNSMDCEMVYSKDYGAAIFKTGYLAHKERLVGLSVQEKEIQQNLNVPKEFLDDFLARRDTNLTMILQALLYLEEDVFESYSIMQDDSSSYGYTAMDQEVIKKRVVKLKNKDKLYLYPGADEVGMVLLTKVFLNVTKRRPKVYVLYPGPTCHAMIPNLEDRPLDVMVRHQLDNIGALRVESLLEADAIFYIHAPADTMISTFSEVTSSRGIDVLINSTHAMELLKHYKKEYLKHIFVADVTYGNGSKLEIYHLLQKAGLLEEIDSFAGWNTAANTIGSSLAQGIISMYLGQNKMFLYERFLEDIGYCGYVRQDLNKNVLPRFMGTTYYDFSKERHHLNKVMQEKMQLFLESDLIEIAQNVKIEKLEFVWDRLYEIDLTLKER